jgi:hypothetical protein
MRSPARREITSFPAGPAVKFQVDLWGVAERSLASPAGSLSGQKTRRQSVRLTVIGNGGASAEGLSTIPVTGSIQGTLALFVGFWTGSAGVMGSSEASWLRRLRRHTRKSTAAAVRSNTAPTLTLANSMILLRLLTSEEDLEEWMNSQGLGFKFVSSRGVTPNATVVNHDSIKIPHRSIC